MENKNTHRVREASKFLAGLITADIVFGIWVWSGGIAAGQTFFGIPIAPPVLHTWLAADALFLLLLIFYGWHIVLPAARTRKLLLAALGILLSAVAAAHFLRLALSLPVSIGGAAIPMWPSIIGAIIAGFLAYASFHFAVKK